MEDERKEGMTEDDEWPGDVKEEEDLDTVRLHSGRRDIHAPSSTAAVVGGPNTEEGEEDSAFLPRAHDHHHQRRPRTKRRVRYVGPTANRLCSQRVAGRRDRLHKQKLRNAKSSINNGGKVPLRRRQGRKGRGGKRGPESYSATKVSKAGGGRPISAAAAGHFRPTPSSSSRPRTANRGRTTAIAAATRPKSFNSYEYKERRRRIQRENDILIRRILDVDKKHKQLRKKEFYLEKKHVKLRSLNRKTRDDETVRVFEANKVILDRILNVRPQMSRSKWKNDEKQRKKILRRLKAPLYIEPADMRRTAEAGVADNEGETAQGVAKMLAAMGIRDLGKRPKTSTSGKRHVGGDSARPATSQGRRR